MDYVSGAVPVRRYNYRMDRALGLPFTIFNIHRDLIHKHDSSSASSWRAFIITYPVIGLECLVRCIDHIFASFLMYNIHRVDFLRMDRASALPQVVPTDLASIHL